MLLHRARSRELGVLLAPFNVASDDTVLQPDILVARRADLTYRDLPTAPVLAVRCSPRAPAGWDRTLKKARLEAVRCPPFWVVAAR